MIKETIEVSENDSEYMESTGLVLSVRTAFGKESDVVIGYPGLQNEKRRIFTGDSVLYEAPTGTFEVRVLKQNTNMVRFLVTQLTPNPGIAGAFTSSDPTNTMFSDEEIRKIAESIEQTKESIRNTSEIQAEQLDLVYKKLDEIADASTRLGRKDWINYVAGAITSTCASAAFAPDVTKDIFLALNSSFSWLFNSTVLFLK